MRKLLLLSAVALLGLAAPALAPKAHAQTPANCGVNYFPIVGVNCANIRQATYIGQMSGLVPAASATDFMCINGNATKNVRIRSWRISGTAGTLVTTPIFIRRITGTLNTGTASAAITGPRALDSKNPTSVTVVTGYDSTGGNPTVTGTTALMAAQELTLPVSGTSAMPADRLSFNFGTQLDAYAQGLDIVAGATTTQFCLNLGAVSVTTGKLNGEIIWTED